MIFYIYFIYITLLEINFIFDIVMLFTKLPLTSKRISIDWLENPIT